MTEVIATSEVNQDIYSGVISQTDPLPPLDFLEQNENNVLHMFLH